MSSLNPRIALVLIVLLLATSSVWADSWGTSLVTATPQFLPGGKTYIATAYGTSSGHGVVSEAPFDCDGVLNCISIARMFVPVVEPRGTEFKTLWLRATDTASAGYVRASLYRQDLTGGSPELLGFVQTQDGGHEVLMDSVKATDPQGNVGPVVIGPLTPLEPTYTYFIEVRIVRESLIYDPDAKLIAYDVGFDLEPCSSPELPSFDGNSCV